MSKGNLPHSSVRLQEKSRYRYQALLSTEPTQSTPAGGENQRVPYQVEGAAHSQPKVKKTRKVKDFSILTHIQQAPKRDHSVANCRILWYRVASIFLGNLFVIVLNKEGHAKRF